jgi:hypothetical protein
LGSLPCGRHLSPFGPLELREDLKDSRTDWGGEQILFACFSIPFWLVGIGMLISIVYSAYS